MEANFRVNAASRTRCTLLKRRLQSYGIGNASQQSAVLADFRATLKQRDERLAILGADRLKKFGWI